MPDYDPHGRPRRYLYRHNPKKTPPRICPTCGKEFRNRSRTTYCSRACFGRTKAKTRVELVCVACGNDYKQFPYRAETSKFCSWECWSDRAPMATCPGCGTSFKAYAGRKYCSLNCSAHRTGEDAPAWKGGASLINDRARYANELREWRLAVYRRDNFRCRDCGTKGYINAHHIKYWSTHPELRFDVDNGITLCVDCHWRVHGKKRIKPHPTDSATKRRRSGSRPGPSPGTIS